MKYKLFFLFFLLFEFFLRICFPALAADIFSLNFPNLESPFLYNEKIGYELKPYALIKSGPDSAWYLERLNSDGFRGPEYIIPKPKDTFRILVIGDSLVQQQELKYSDTWEVILENLLNQKEYPLRFEVINAGIGGYVSWQVLERLKTRGLKYQPDLVILVVGKNDLIFSTLSYWRPKINLADIESAYQKKNSCQRINFFKRIRLFLYKYFYTFRLVRNLFNSLGDFLYRTKIILQHKNDSKIPFNQQALDLYLENLGNIYGILKENNIGMALVIWPTILEEDLLNSPLIHQKLFLLYQHFPLSAKELLMWNKRYILAQKEFFRIHSDIILIDGEEFFLKNYGKKRIKLFKDFVHMNKEGTKIIAKLIYDNLVKNIK